MSPMEVETRSFGPVIGGLEGAGVTASGTGAAGGWPSGAGAALAPAGGACSCATAGAAMKREKARARAILCMPILLPEHATNKKPRAHPRLAVLPLPVDLVQADRRELIL